MGLLELSDMATLGIKLMLTDWWIKFKPPTVVSYKNCTLLFVQYLYLLKFYLIAQYATFNHNAASASASTVPPKEGKYSSTGWIHKFGLDITLHRH